MFDCVQSVVGYAEMGIRLYLQQFWFKEEKHEKYGFPSFGYVHKEKSQKLSHKSGYIYIIYISNIDIYWI